MMVPGGAPVCAGAEDSRVQRLEFGHAVGAARRFRQEFRGVVTPSARAATDARFGLRSDHRGRDRVRLVVQREGGEGCAAGGQARVAPRQSPLSATESPLSTTESLVLTGCLFCGVPGTICYGVSGTDRLSLGRNTRY
eukprot:1481931-Rhodomonas_salina.1